MFKDEISIGTMRIGPGHKPVVIAEMSGNHNQSLEMALEIVDAAADSGAHALKIQTYTADTMTLDLDEGEFRIDDENSLWNGTSLYKLYQKAHTPWEWHRTIFERCKQEGMLAFSTPFDATAVDFLEDIGVEAYKVASFENTDIPLLRKVAATGKPMIISTGMATIEELKETVAAVRQAGCKDLILLKCTSSYPANPKDSNLLTIPDMREQLGVQVGLSDHTLGIGAAVASVALGATVIEKHFTLDRSNGGVDSAFSLEPNEMKSLVLEVERAWMALGKVSYGTIETEKRSLQFRRSLYISKDIKEGETLTPENLRCIRPGYGLAPKHYDDLLGKKITKDVPRGTALRWNLVSEK